MRDNILLILYDYDIQSES